MKNQAKEIFFSLILVCVLGKSIGQNCASITNASDLKLCLDGANPLPGQTVTITISADIDLDPLIASGDLPLKVKTGVILTGDYDLLSNPNGTIVTSTYRNSYFNSICDCPSNSTSRMYQHCV